MRLYFSYFFERTYDNFKKGSMILYHRDMTVGDADAVMESYQLENIPADITEMSVTRALRSFSIEDLTNQDVPAQSESDFGAVHPPHDYNFGASGSSDHNSGAVEEYDETELLSGEDNLSPFDETAANLDVNHDTDLSNAHLRTQIMDQDQMDQIQMDQMMMEQSEAEPANPGLTADQVNHFQVQVQVDNPSANADQSLTSNSDSNNNLDDLVPFGPEYRAPAVLGNFTLADLTVDYEDMDEFQRQIRSSFVKSVALLQQRLGTDNLNYF